MEFMFDRCRKLKQIIGINKFNTIKVTNMRGMFNECNELKNLNLSSFNTTNVIDLCIMFQECFELEYLDISNFNLTNAKDISWMFNRCYKLKEIKGINNITSIKNIVKKGLFNYCYNLNEASNYINKTKENIEKKQISIRFTSADQTINYSGTFYNTDIFETIKEKSLYSKYPQLKNKEIYFIGEGTKVNERVSLEDKNIKDRKKNIVIEM